jgi:hypothetical protein
MIKKTIFAFAMLCCCGAFATDVDLNEFIHGGSLERPLAGTTFSASSGEAIALDAVTRRSDEGVMDTALDSWCQYRAEAILSGTFNSTEFGRMVIVFR